MCTHGGIFAKIPPSQHSGLAERDSLAHPAQHVGGTVLRHDPHDDPSHSLQQLDPTNVLHVLPAIGTVLVAVVFDGHHPLVPTHVEIGKGDSVSVLHLNLGTGGG